MSLTACRSGHTRHSHGSSSLASPRGAFDLRRRLARVEHLRALVASLQIRPLAAYGVQAANLPELVERSRRASSMKGNPIELTNAELHEALAAAL